MGSLGIGGQPFDRDRTGGVGVQGIAGGTADGVVGISEAQSRSGVFGFNSLALQRPDVASFGVFGRCDTAGGAGFRRSSAFGVGARAHRAGNDGVVGLSDGAGKSGVFGFNSREAGVGNGVFGRCDADEGAGVGGNSSLGVGVRGTAVTTMRLSGLATPSEERGLWLQLDRQRPGLWRVWPLQLGARRGRRRGERSWLGGVSGAGSRRCGSSRKPPPGPASGSHQVGEFFVDSAGDLFFCKVGGVGAAAKWIKLA